MRVVDITSDRINKYILKRQKEGVSNGTINRELAALKRMFSLGAQATTPKVVHDTFGQGRTFDAKTAIGLGMADRVGTLESEIDRLVNAQRVRRGRRATAQRNRLELL